MSIIAQAEDTVIAQLQSVLANRVRSVESLSGPWTMAALKRALQFAPCVRIAFLGGKVSDMDAEAIHARFGVYCIAGQVTDTQRRRGTAREIGIYEMIELIAPALHGFSIQDIGTLSLDNVAPLFTEQTLQLGGAVYAAMFTLPNLVLPVSIDPATLNDFLLFHDAADSNGDGTSDIIIEEVIPNA